VLKPGELICDKCNGKGSVEANERLMKIKTCPKCLGAKKVDWIENAMGKQPKDWFFDSSAAVWAQTESELYIHGKPLDEHILDVMAKEIAKEVDKQILEKMKISYGGKHL